jgi:hypothetical protein
MAGGQRHQAAHQLTIRPPRPIPPGDRHLGNMLLDKSSAAVLQIDLGVAFEQGMFLNTPEMVGGREAEGGIDGWR